MIRFEESKIYSAVELSNLNEPYIKGKLSNIPRKEVELTKVYLKNPTKCGIWKLKGKWNRKGNLIYDIEKYLNEELKKEEILIGSGQRKINIKVTENLHTQIKEATGRITFVFNLFTHLLNLNKQSINAFYNYLELKCPGDKLIFDIINLQEIQTKYSDAYDYFKENIYFDEFHPLIYENKITQIKDGFFILSDSLTNNDNQLELISLKLDVLERISTFFQKLDKISEDFIFSIFSPEEEVFKPYFLLLEQAYTYFDFTDNSKRQLKRSISEYYDENYSYSVSTLGIIGEELLTEIYETIFREVCPKNKTLGQIYNLIHTKIKDILNITPKEKPKVEPIYNRLKDLELNLDVTNDKTKEIISILRDVLKHIREDKLHTCNLIDSSKSDRQTISIFPTQIRENIEEFINYRNATAHRTKIPIGNYESLRTVYCYISFYIWWINEKKEINWKEDQETILKKIIEKYNGVSIF